MSSAFDHKIPGSSSIGMWWLVGDLHSNPGGGRPLEKKDMDISVIFRTGSNSELVAKKIRNNFALQMALPAKMWHSVFVLNLSQH